LATYQQLWQSTGSNTPGQTAQPPQTPPAYQPPAHQAPQYQPSGLQGQRPHIPSYLGWAIAVLLLCFWPTGIAAVVYATRVDSMLAYGDIAGAWEASRKAKMWCWISFGIAMAGLVLALLFILIVVGIGSAALTCALV
jgi:hypothetical protein